MIWTTWRQHRSEALAGAAALAVPAALAMYGSGHRAFGYSNDGFARPVMLTLLLLPALVGVFVGAPLFGRDLVLVAWQLRPRYLPPLVDEHPDWAIFHGHSRWFPYVTPATLGDAVSYQPGERFWVFQSIESALFLALAALLVGFTVYWVTRRVR